MIKKTILLLIFCSQLKGQNMSKKEFQKNRYDLGKSFLEKGKNAKAIQLFHFAHHIIPDNELGCNAFKKYDSLKPILRMDLKRKLIGNWKKINDKPNWVYPNENDIIGEMLSINDTEILFYEICKNTTNWTLVKTEPLEFCTKGEIEKKYIEREYTFTEFTYKNKEVWQFYFDENLGTLKTYLVGFESENSVLEILCGSPSYEYFKIE